MTGFLLTFNSKSVVVIVCAVPRMLTSFFFLSDSDPFLSTHCRRRGLLLHLITLHDTHTHKLALLWTRARPDAETST